MTAQEKEQLRLKVSQLREDFCKAKAALELASQALREAETAELLKTWKSVMELTFDVDNGLHDVSEDFLIFFNDSELVHGGLSFDELLKLQEEGLCLVC
jgi:hypothetical protein